jgi:hypothetical protein
MSYNLVLHNVHGRACGRHGRVSSYWTCSVLVCLLNDTVVQDMDTVVLAIDCVVHVFLVMWCTKFMIIILCFEHHNNTSENICFCRQHTMDSIDDFDESAANKDSPAPTPKGLTLEDVMEEIKGLKLIVYEVANKQNTVEKVHLFYLHVWYYFDNVG